MRDQIETQTKSLKAQTSISGVTVSFFCRHEKGSKAAMSTIRWTREQEFAIQFNEPERLSSLPRQARENGCPNRTYYRTRAQRLRETFSSPRHDVYGTCGDADESKDHGALANCAPSLMT